MFYVREDDMDDLLRRAAEKFEVDASEAADWDSVYQAVHKEAPVAVPQKRKRRFVFWWLLLIPVGWFANSEWNKFHHAAVQKPVNAVKEKPSVPYENVEKSQTASANDAQLKQQQKVSNQNSNNYDKKVAGNNFNHRNSTVAELVPATPKPKADVEVKEITSEKQVLPEPGQVINNNTNLDESKILPRQNSTLPDLLKTDDSKKDATKNQPVTSQTIKKKQPNSTHYLYAGLLVGGDISFVKFQKANAAGYSLGLLAGYKFNRLSIETGFIYDKKNYYTKGEYFDKTKIPFFYNAELVSVDGYCHMYEIPLNLKYNFSTKKNHAWFASAGLSSYLMNKEYYNYDYIKNDSAHHSGYAYYHASKNWFSVVNLSAGYELKTGDKTTLRIEPYYKMAVSGVGTGNLSLSSTGINIGLTRRIP